MRWEFVLSLALALASSWDFPVLLLCICDPLSCIVPAPAQRQCAQCAFMEQHSAVLVQYYTPGELSFTACCIVQIELYRIQVKLSARLAVFCTLLQYCSVRKDRPGPWELTIIINIILQCRTV